MTTIITIIRRKLTVLAAAAFIAPMFAIAMPAQALTYVNLLTGEPMPEPVSVSYGAQSGNPESMPANVAADAATQLYNYRTALLQSRQASEANMQQQVASLDRMIHEAHVEREMARSNWYALRTQESVQRFNAAQARIEQLQTARWNVISAHFVGNINAFNDLSQRDSQNQAFYGQWSAYNQSLYTQALSTAQATFGIKQ